VRKNFNYKAILTILFLLFSGLSFCHIRQHYSKELFFHRLTSSDGLSQGTINCIAQDYKGFIWIATNDGLNRYDGYNIRVYRNNINDAASISSNQVLKIVPDRKGKIWILTGNGLNLFDPSVDSFTLISNEFLSNQTEIATIAADDTHIWVGTVNSGLIRIDQETLMAESFLHIPANAESISNNGIHYLHVDSGNHLWVCLRNGDFGVFDSKTNTFSPVELLNHRNQKFANNITAIQEDKNGNFYITSNGSSLIYFDTQNHQLRYFRNEFPDGTAIFMDYNSIVLQNDSTLWLGTYDLGLERFDLKTNNFTIFDEGAGNQRLLYPNIRTLFKDKDGNLWIGTYGKGINILNYSHRNFLNFTASAPEKMRLNFSSVRSILQLNDSILLVGGYRGLQKINLKQETTIYWKNPIPYCLLPDISDPDIVWVGSEGWGVYQLNLITGKLQWTGAPKILLSPNEVLKKDIIVYKMLDKDENHFYAVTNYGLSIINRHTYDSKNFYHNPSDNQSLVSGYVTNIFRDNLNRIWVGSQTGNAALFDPVDETFQQINFGTYSSKIESIYCFHQDVNGQLWMGTNIGLIKMGHNGEVERQFSESDGLPNNVVYGILEDAKGNFWLSTNVGISNFNSEDSSFINFTLNDGLPANEFNSAAYFQKGQSRLYFGSVNGMVFFEPDLISTTQKLSQVVITDFKTIGNQQNIQNQVSYTNSIQLSPTQKIMMMDFSTLQYFVSGQTTYEFRLVGEMENFANLEKGRTLTLTLPRPGKHILEVRARNNFGETIEKPLQLNINLLPYFYQTIWFRITILLLIAASVIVLYIFRVKIIQQQKLKLELLVDQRTTQLNETNKELKEANETKDKFFSIIAHDLKNPFNSLLGFTDLLINDWNELSEEEKIEFISIIKNTTEETFRLLMNLLEWSTIQKKQVTFIPDKVLVSEIINETRKHLNPYAYFKNIRIYIDEIPENLIIEADPNMLLTVFRNLVSNAIKFTPKNGQITISAEVRDENIKFCIEDNGIGMTKKVSDNLFKLNLKTPGKGTEGESGTGLGLVLCHEFIKMHNGKLWAESEPGEGSRFYFTIPLMQLNK